MELYKPSESGAIKAVLRKVNVQSTFLRDNPLRARRIGAISWSLSLSHGRFLLAVRIDLRETAQNKSVEQ